MDLNELRSEIFGDIRGTFREDLEAGIARCQAIATEVERIKASTHAVRALVTYQGFMDEALAVQAAFNAAFPTIMSTSDDANIAGTIHEALGQEVLDIVEAGLKLTPPAFRWNELTIKPSTAALLLEQGLDDTRDWLDQAEGDVAKSPKGRLANALLAELNALIADFQSTVDLQG